MSSQLLGCLGASSWALTSLQDYSFNLNMIRVTLSQGLKFGSEWLIFHRCFWQRSKHSVLLPAKVLPSQIVTLKGWFAPSWFDLRWGGVSSILLWQICLCCIKNCKPTGIDEIIPVGLHCKSCSQLWEMSWNCLTGTVIQVLPFQQGSHVSISHSKNILYLVLPTLLKHSSLYDLCDSHENLPQKTQPEKEKKTWSIFCLSLAEALDSK